MIDKKEIARVLAEAHRQELDTITRIVRLCGSREMDSAEPVKLLEVNPGTSPSGIWPIALGPAPPEIPYGSVIVEVTPGEYEDILSGQLRLPDHWELGETLFPTEE